MLERRSNIPKQDNGQESLPEATNPLASLSAAEMEKLDKPELIAIIERMGRQCGFVACLSAEDTAQAITDRLAANALNGAVKEFLPYAREALDRIKGKSTQYIDQRIQTVSHTATGEMTNAQLMAALMALPNLPVGVKLLADGMLDVVDGEYSEA